MSDEENPNCFISRCACGGLTFASVDLPERRKQNAKDVADLIRAGRTIENMPVLEVRAAKWCVGKCTASSASSVHSEGK